MRLTRMVAWSEVADPFGMSLLAFRDFSSAFTKVAMRRALQTNLLTPILGKPSQH